MTLRPGCTTESSPHPTEPRRENSNDLPHRCHRNLDPHRGEFIPEKWLSDVFLMVFMRKQPVFIEKYAKIRKEVGK
jgi:hypothetical protein